MYLYKAFLSDTRVFFPLIFSSFSIFNNKSCCRLLLLTTDYINRLPTLPVDLRSTFISREQYRAGLKTHLFNQAYNILWERFVLRVYYTYLLMSARPNRGCVGTKTCTGR